LRPTGAQMNETENCLTRGKEKEKKKGGNSNERTKQNQNKTKQTFLNK